MMAGSFPERASALPACSRKDKMQELQPGIHEYTLTITDKQLSVQCDFHPDSADLILFLHGLACSRESFHHVFERPYFPDVTLLAPDLLGFGLSAKPEEFSYTMEDQAMLCEHLLAMFPFQHLHVVAHSMGNAVALLLSSKVSSSLRSFANMEGNLIGEDCGLLSRGIISVPLHDYQMRGFADHQREFAGHSQLRFDQTTATAVYKSARSLVRWSDSGELFTMFERLPCKTRYFWGEENAGMPILRKLEGFQSSMVPRSGHGMMTDNPDAFYPALTEFICSQ